AVGERWLAVSTLSKEVWQAVIGKLLRRNMETDDNGHPRPFLVRLTEDGKREWQAFTDGHAAELNGDSFPDHLRGPWAKLRGYCGRLALIVHCLRRACGEVQGRDVDGESMAHAARLVGYFKAHARRALAAMGADPRLDDAKRVWD